MKTLNHLSPSNALSVESCLLKEIWSSEKKIRSLPVHPAAWLGIVSHLVLEKATKGQIQDKSSFDNAWIVAESSVEKQMKQSYPDSHLVPLSKSSRFYEVKKIMTWKIIRGILESSGTYGAHQVTSAEKWLHSKDRKIIGRVDLVRTSSENVEIVDYKIGRIKDDLDNIKEAYKLQMQAYAALYHETTSRWPTKLTIIGLDGSKYNVSFTEEDCESLLNKMKELIDHVNKKILSGATEQDMADPSPSVCSFCQYRVDCISYWKARGDTGEWPNDIRGKVTEQTISTSGLVRVVIDTEDGMKVVRALSKRHGLIDVESKELAFCNLTKDITKDHFIENYMTICYQF